jgi:hypothetical protein
MAGDPNLKSPWVKRAAQQAAADRRAARIGCGFSRVDFSRRSRLSGKAVMRIPAPEKFL